MAQSMKEDWGEDGWEEDMDGVDYLGADIDDDDEMFARQAGYDYLDDGMMFGGGSGGGDAPPAADDKSLTSGNGVGLIEDDDGMEPDKDLEAAEWEYDALNDVDGGEDDDVDNIAEAFAQGEYNKMGEDFADVDGAESSPSSASSETNLDKAWGSGWAASDEEMDGSIGAHFKAAAKAIEAHVDVKQAVVGTQQRMKIAVAETMGLDPTAGLCTLESS
jgi:hypothetical protein